MARIPTTLGERPVPQPQRGVASVSAGLESNDQARAAAIEAASSQALAQDVGHASDVLYQVGVRQKEKVDRLDLANAQAAFLKDKIAADNSYDDDKDYLTIHQRYTKQVTDSRKAASTMIKDPLLRKQFEADADLEIMRGQYAMKDLAKRKEIDHGRATIAQQVDDNAAAALNSADSDTRAGLLKASSMAIDSGIARGYYSEVEGQNLKSQLARQYTAQQQEQLGVDYDSKVQDLARQAYQTGDADSAIAALTKLTEGYAGSLPAAELAKAQRDAKDHLIQLSLLSPNVKPADAMRRLVGSAPIDTPPQYQAATPELVSAVRGSEGTPDGRRSPAGALGVMQILPETAREVAGELGIPYDANRLQHDPAYSEQLGAAYLTKLLKRYDGNSMLAIAAYNAGMGRVDTWLKDHGDPRKGEVSSADWIASIPFDETRNYVTRTLNTLGAGKPALPDVNAMKASGVVKADATNFNTALSPDEETKFRKWVVDNHVPFEPTAVQSDYDMRGFWKALEAGDPKAKAAIDPNDRLIHYPDYWKTPLHKTFSNESQWAGPNAPHWTKDDKLVRPDGSVQFDDRAGQPRRALASEIDPAKLPGIQAQIEGRQRELDQQAATDRAVRQDDAKAKFGAHLASLTATGKAADGFNLDDYESAFDPKTFEAMKAQEESALRLNRWVGPITTGTPADVARVLQEAAPVPGAANFDQQVEEFNAVQAAVKKREEALAKDPAAYAIENDPAAQKAFAVLQGDQDPRPQAAADKRYASEQLKQAQIRLGADPLTVRPMPQAMADQLVGDVVNAPQDQVAAELDQIERDYGPDGLAQVAASKGAPPTIKVAAFANDPQDGLIRQRMIEAGRMKDQELNDGVKIRGFTADDISTAVADKTKELLDTMPAASAAPYVAGFEQTVKYLVSRGATPSEAAEQAWAPFARAYTFGPTYRIPAAYEAGKVEAAMRGTIDGLQGMDLEIPGGGDPLVGEDYQKAETIRSLRDNGVWVTNQNDTGLILTYGDESGLPGDPVMLKDGRRVELLFENAVQPGPPPTSITPFQMGGAKVPVGQSAPAASAAPSGPGPAGPAQREILAPPPAPAVPPKRATGAEKRTSGEGSFGDTVNKAKVMFMTERQLRAMAAKGNQAAAAELKARGLKMGGARFPSQQNAPAASPAPSGTYRPGPATAEELKFMAAGSLRKRAAAGDAAAAAELKARGLK